MTALTLNSDRLTIRPLQSELGIDPVYAMASADNERSIAILQKLGMKFEKNISTKCDCCTSLFSTASAGDPAES